MKRRNDAWGGGLSRTGKKFGWAELGLIGICGTPRRTAESKCVGGQVLQRCEAATRESTAT